MGLFIQAFSDTEHVGQHANSNDDDVFEIRPGQGNEEKLDEMKPNLYRAGSEVRAFCAGSYNGVEEWLHVLCRAMHESTQWKTETYDGMFFTQLFCHPLDGAYGPKTSKLLADVFEMYRDRAEAVVRRVYADENGRFGGPNGNAWFMDYYDDWHKAFKLASQNGFIIFG